MAIGTFLLTSAAIVAGGMIYLNSKKDGVVNLEDLSTEEEKYEEDKWIVEDAIKKHNIEKLKRLREVKSIAKYDDLQKMIDDALKKYK